MFQTNRPLWTAALLALLPFGSVFAQDTETLPAEDTASSPPAEESSGAAPGRPTNALIQEVVVTAQKREQSVHDVGVAISAFSGDALKSLGVQNTTDLAGLVPGFTYANSGYSVPIYTIRGVGFNETSETASSTVGIYSDEVNLPYPSMTKGADLDLQRVEVLKGPQGTLYGRNTTGGAINYIANKPTTTLKAGISETYSNYDTNDTEGYISGPLTDELSGRFAFRNVWQREGWQYDYMDPKYKNGQQDDNAVRGILQWDPDQDFTLRLTLDGWQENSQPQFAQAFVHLDQSLIAGFAPSPEIVHAQLAPNDDDRATSWNHSQHYYLRERFGEASLHADWRIDDTNTMTTIAAIQNYKNSDHLDLDGLPAEEYEYYIDTRDNVASLESRLAGKLLGNESLQYTAGVFFSGDTVSEKRIFNLGANSEGDGGIVFRTVGLDGYQTAQTQALFGQLEWQANDQFKVTAGLRGTSEARKFNDCTRDVNGDAALLFTALQDAAKLGLGKLVGYGISQPQASAILAYVNSKVPTNAEANALGNVVQQLLDTPIPGIIETALGGPHRGGCFTLDKDTNTSGPTFGSLDESNLSGRIAMDWTPNKDMRYYASTSLGYKSGSFPVIPASNSIQEQPVKQEKLLAYEIGFKDNFFDDALKVDGAAFHYDYTDKQLYAFYKDQIFGVLFKLDNVPKSTIDGVELNGQYSPLAGLYLSLGASYLHSRVDRYVGIDAKGNTLDYSGKELAYTPPFSLSAVIDYERPFSTNWEYNVGVNGRYQTKAQGELDNDPTFEQPGYYLLNAHVGVNSLDDAWALTAFVHNLTDKVYYTSLYRLSDVGVRYTGLPRTFGITLSYHY